MDKKTNRNEPYKRNLDAIGGEENKNDEEQPRPEQPEEKKQTSAAGLDSIISSPTGNVRARHKTGTWGNTGTNISYEGQTAPGGMGSVGTGEASGQDATGARIQVPDADTVRHKKDEQNKDEEEEDKSKDII